MSVTLHVSVWVEIFLNQDFPFLFECHAPRERVSWNENIDITFDVTTSHAPRERVSWNANFYNSIGVNAKSRSTWACELKYNGDSVSPERSGGHAPRERVSWNKIVIFIISPLRVTLHVSVWVEIARRLPVVEEQIVTLHVSVWVEMISILE